MVTPSNCLLRNFRETKNFSNWVSAYVLTQFFLKQVLGKGYVQKLRSLRSALTEYPFSKDNQ